MTPLKNNRAIAISTGTSRKCQSWRREEMMWSDFCSRLQKPVRGEETLTEYLRLTKAQQDDLKDVGGFTGVLRGGRRCAANIVSRDIVTLDLDNIRAMEGDAVLKKIASLGCASAVYSTRKHESVKPRLRVIIPLSRSVSAEEYEPVARLLASKIGIVMCDPSTFEASRLMYWPSACADTQYVFAVTDNPFADADALLAMYDDWHDVTKWPVVPGASDTVAKSAHKAEDPTEKKGIIGAFCREYDIERAIAELIPDSYIQCGEGRYTYAGGSTTGGAVVYEGGKFLYSNHATDPAGGRLSNAFDLVRIHKYGVLDDEAKADTPVNKMPSYAAMCAFANSIDSVAIAVMSERTGAADDFGGDADAKANAETKDWMLRLKRSGDGSQILKTTDNIRIILEGDPALKGKIAIDEYAGRSLVLGALPWNRSEARREWSDDDDAGVRWYIERTYGIASKDKTADALSIVASAHKINELRDYLDGLVWDGTPRIDTLLIDYFGAADNAYTRAVMRKTLCAAAARVYLPGVKFDTMTILCGAQGVGKSTFLKILGGKWFSDSLGEFDGKDAYELLQGYWVIELGELKGMSQSEINTVKQFLSKTEDVYRAPYGRRTARHPRGCIFIGTTNEAEFLRDTTGNRRFWSVDLGGTITTKSVFCDLAGERDQIWAEAVTAWRGGEALYLTGEAESLAMRSQDDHREANPKEGIIREFLARPIPVAWDKYDLGKRRMYWSGDFGGNNTAELRTKVCAAEIYVECFGGDLKFMQQRDAREINGILQALPGIEKSYERYGPYGVQRGYRVIQKT